jgi:hypothetical protein
MDYITSYGKLLFVLINWCDWKKEKRPYFDQFPSITQYCTLFKSMDLTDQSLAQRVTNQWVCSKPYQGPFGNPFSYHTFCQNHVLEIKLSASFLKSDFLRQNFLQTILFSFY